MQNFVDVCGENSLRTWIKYFFFIPQFTIVNAYKLQKLYPFFDKWALVLLNEEIEMFVLLKPLHNLKMCGAFIATFTSKKTMDDDQKKFITQFANLPMPILV